MAAALIQPSVTSGTKSGLPVRKTLLTGWSNRAKSRDKLIDFIEEFVLDRVGVCPAHPLDGPIDGKDVNEAKVGEERHGTEGETFQSGLIVAGNELRADVQQKALARPLIDGDRLSPW